MDIRPVHSGDLPSSAFPCQMTDLAEPDICSSVDLHQGSEPEGAQDQFGVLFDTMFDGAYVVDRERRILEWNPAATALSGYSSEQILGHRCSDNFLVHVDECGNKLCVDHCPLQATIDDGVARQMRVYLRHKQGHRIPVTVRNCSVKRSRWPCHRSGGGLSRGIDIRRTWKADGRIGTTGISRQADQFTQSALRGKPPRSS